LSCSSFSFETVAEHKKGNVVCQKNSMRLRLCISHSHVTTAV
jgi:hypothetical protein